MGVTTNKKLKAEVEWSEDLVRIVIGNPKTKGIDTVAFKDAVKEYQSRRGLMVDGLVGPQTWGYMRVERWFPNDQDVDRLADVITAECGSLANKIESVCVAFTVINRLLKRPGKYGAMIDEIASGKAYSVRSRVDITPTSEALSVASACLQGEVDDPTNGATHFFSPRSMPKQPILNWDEIKEHVSRRYYRDPEDGRIFLWDPKIQRRIYTSVKGGWHSVRAPNGVSHTVAFPGFAASKKYVFVSVKGVRDWFFRFYRRKE